MKWQLDDIPVFVAVVQQQGITAAAEVLAMPKSSVSRTITRLEEALQLRLLERNSRSIRLTQDGEVFYRHCLQILDQVEETNACVSGLHRQPSGKLVVALPMAFGRTLIARHIAEFHQRYPDIQLELIISSHKIDLIAEQVDLALVIGPLQDSELIARPLLESPLIWISSPKYLQAQTNEICIDQLAAHIQICETRYGISKFSVSLGDHHYSLDLSQASRVNDSIVVRDVVCNGAGISMVPRIYCQDQLRNGELVQLFADTRFAAAASLVSAIYPSRRMLPAKVRVFLSFLEQIIEQRE